MGTAATQEQKQATKDLKQQVYCPVAATMDLLNKKWTLHIIHTLMSGKKRHNELMHLIGTVNSRTLCDRLRSLEEEGIVARHVINTIPPWVEYELTAKGRALNLVIQSIAEWGITWMADRVAHCLDTPREECCEP
jgi:DNA-binding HxlR family transcriptional regulator